MESWAQSTLDDKALERDLDEREREAVELLLNRQSGAADEVLDDQEREGVDLLPNGRPVAAAESASEPLDEERNQPARVVSLPQCYLEIKTLRWIQNSVVHNTALQEWERKTELLTARVERKRKQALYQRNEIYNLVGFFSVFQGVLLTAVSQSNLLHCNHWWSPFALSVLASVVTCVGVLQKFRDVGALDKTIHSEENSLKVVVKRVNALRRLGKDFRFANSEETKRRKKSSPFSVYATLVCTALVAFAVVFAVSHPIILCHPGCSKTTCNNSS